MAFIKRGAVVKTENLESAVASTAVMAQEPKKLSTAVVSQGHAAKGRDFDAEARGKTRCALEEAWAQSPLLPMLVKDPNDRAELHLILDEIVTERMKRVFPNG